MKDKYPGCSYQKKEGSLGQTMQSRKWKGYVVYELKMSAKSIPMKI
jgi:hypothetical protein